MVADNQFFQRVDKPRCSGPTREKLTAMLVHAISAGMLTKVQKILVSDPSLILEPVGTDSKSYLVISHAVKLGMESLIPFALSNGMDINEPVFQGSPLLVHAVRSLSPTLTSYALSFGASADPGPEMLMHAFGDRDESYADFITFQLTKSTTQDEISRRLQLLRIILDAGSKPSTGRASSVLIQLAKTDWKKLPALSDDNSVCDSLSALFRDLLKSGQNPDMKLLNTPVIKLAVAAKNVQATMILLNAGANIDADFLGMDFAECLVKNNLSEQIPEISDFLVRNQIERQRKLLGSVPTTSAVTDVSAQSPADSSVASPTRKIHADVL